jgi:pimeloyl-ACP methyl ester carboxylesterase
VDATVFELPDGRELAFSEAGDQDGTPVIAFHGTPGSRRQILLPLADQAAKNAQVRLVAPDRPGYGLSTFQPGRRLVDWAKDVSVLADHLGLARFAVLGVSGGGPHALVCAALLADRVTRAAVVSGIFQITGPSDSEGMMPMNRVLASLARRSEVAIWPLTSLMETAAHRRPEQAMKWMTRSLPPSDVTILERPEITQAFIGDFRHTSPTAARAAAQDMAIFARPWGFDLSRIEVPVDFWQGDADRNVPPSHARRQSELVKDSVLHEIPGAGHFLVVDRLEEILRAVAPQGSGPT